MKEAQLSIVEFINLLKTKKDGINGDELQQLIASLDLTYVHNSIALSINDYADAYFLNKSIEIGEFICDVIYDKIEQNEELSSHCKIKNYIDENGIYTIYVDYCWYWPSRWNPDKYIIYQYVEQSKNLLMCYYDSTENYDAGKYKVTCNFIIENQTINDIIYYIFSDIQTYFS